MDTIGRMFAIIGYLLASPLFWVPACVFGGIFLAECWKAARELNSVREGDRTQPAPPVNK